MKRTIASSVICFLISIISYGQDAAVTEYLGIPGPIVLNAGSFNLAWSSHPSAGYYKQEYVGSNDNVEKFKKMVMVELLLGKSKAADLANAKVIELKKLKPSDPLVNYDIFQKNGEIIIDFLLSESSPDGKKINIVERNVYRYRNITEKNGKKGVLLFGVSERGYGNDVDTFLSSLRKTRSALTNAVAAFAIPDITIKK
jgi:hypothetical protein